MLLWNVWEQVEAARQLIAAPGPFTVKNLKGRLPAKISSPKLDFTPDKYGPANSDLEVVKE